MNWNLEAHRWKRSTKVLLGIATIWPIIYMFVFVLGIASMMFFIPSEGRSNRNTEEIDLIQLSQKIDRGELKELRILPREVIALDRVGDRQYHTDVTNSSTRSELLAKAQEHDANGNPRVLKIEVDTAETISPALPAAFVALFGAHMLTIFLILGLMPLYVILAVKNRFLDDTMRIIWVVLLCMLGFFAMPVYWFLYIWREPRTDIASGPAESTFVKV